MRVKFFTIPALDSYEAEVELNRFLAQHRVLAIDRQLVALPGGAFWTVSVSFQDAAPNSVATKRNKVDYKETLSPEDFEVYAALRTLRKEVSERDGVPPYAIFNNAQLAEMVENRTRTTEALRAISGIGPSRAETYGELFLARLATLQLGSGGDGERDR